MTKIDQDLISHLDQAESKSIHASDGLNERHREIFDRYISAPWNEVEDESKVQSTDVYDLIQSDMASHVETFLGHDEVLGFQTTKGTDSEATEADQKTKYIDWLIRKQPGSYKTLHDWMLGAEIYKYSAVNFGFEEEDKVRVVEYEGLTDDEYQLLAIEMSIQEDEGATVSIEDVERKPKDEFKDVKVTIEKTIGTYFERYIDPENFVITSGATSTDDAQMVGHDTYTTKSSLVAAGHDKEIVKDLEVATLQHDTQDRKRSTGQNPQQYQSGNLDWTLDIVKLQTRYIKYDQDGDGIAERIKVLRVGQVVLDDEPHEIAPYAVLCSVMLPGQMIGLSRGEITLETEAIRTTLWRHTMMNAYMVGTGRLAVNKNVNEDDLSVNKSAGYVRVKGENPPLENVAPLPIPFVGDKLMMVMQQADAARAQRTGSLVANQALDTDKLGKETATRFQGIEKASTSKNGMIQRGFAETGWKELYSGMLWTVKHYQKTSLEIMVLGKPMEIDPRRWLSDQPLASNVGLAAGDDEQVLAEMNGLYAISQELKAQGSLLTDDKKIYNILKKVVRASNQPDVSEYFNDPEIPEETLRAAFEQLMIQNQQLQQMAQENPLAEAEEVKAQADLIKAQATQDLNIAKLREESRRFNEELTAKANKTIADLEAKYVELELKYQTDITGKGQGQ